MAKDKKSYAVSFVINVHRSTLTKKQVEKLAKDLAGQLHASFDAGLASGVTGDSSLRVKNAPEPPFTPWDETMTLEELRWSIAGQMDKLGPLEDFDDPMVIRMADGNPLIGARVIRNEENSGWELWLSDAERL